jgi:hypothetical protein
MIDTWLALPLPAMVLTLAGAYFASAAFLFWLSFGPGIGAWTRKFNGVVPPYFSAIMAIFGILIGFLASDVWDRNRRAAADVQIEGASLTTLDALASAADWPVVEIRRAIRRYASAVIEKEWPSMASEGTGAKEAETALGALLKTVAATASSRAAKKGLDGVLLDTALKVQAARANRLIISADYSESVKWACVLILALVGQISIALVHLDRPRPQVAAMTIFTLSMVVILALIAAHEGPFQPPLAIKPTPLANVLKLIPAP